MEAGKASQKLFYGFARMKVSPRTMNSSNVSGNGAWTGTTEERDRGETLEVTLWPRRSVNLPSRE
jgi:hypothetical protein